MRSASASAARRRSACARLPGRMARSPWCCGRCFGGDEDPMRLRGCWSCGSHGRCYDGCECTKCLDPEDYSRWRCENPEEYREWLDSQRLEHDEECDCPSCLGTACPLVR
jgi:hypothetical protein